METTPEQRSAVRRDECRVNGHTFSEMCVMGRLAPQLVLCTNCGAQWRIHPEDVDKDF